MPDILVSALLFAELILLTASWYKFQARDLGAADALARALALSLAGLGFAVLALFVLRLSPWHGVLDALILAFAALAYRFGKREFVKDMSTAFGKLRHEPLFWFLLALAAALTLLAIAEAPANPDSMAYNLARVLMMRNENTLGLINYNSARQLAFSPGFDLLHFFFLRFQTDYGIAVFSLMAYGVVVLASYALARQRGTRSFALRVAVVIASLKLPIMQATTTKNDLGAAAMAVACILGASSLFSRKKPDDPLLLIVCLAFGLSVKTYFVFFAAPFLIASIILNRTTAKNLLIHFVRERPRLLALGLALFVVLTALGMSTQIICAARFGDPFGPREMVSVHENRDGAAGAAANVVRYALQIPDLPGSWWRDTVKTVYGSLFDRSEPGALYSFREYVLYNQWNEDFSWFGLIGGLLIFPLALAGLGARDRLARSVSVGLWGYFLLVSATIAWMPWNGRFFSLFFAASAVCLIAWRRAWHDRTLLRAIILAVSMLTALAALVIPGKFSQVPALFAGRAARIRPYYGYFHGPALLDALVGQTGREALLIAGNNSWVYPILRTDHHWTVTGQDNPIVRLDGQSYNIHDCNQLFQLSRHFDLVVILDHKPALDCRLPFKLVMQTPITIGDAQAAVYAPNPPAPGSR